MSDLYCAAFLIARGQTLTDVLPLYEGKRSGFIFKASETLAADCNAFSANAEIAVRDFLDGIYEVKRILRKETNETHEHNDERSE